MNELRAPYCEHNKKEYSDLRGFFKQEITFSVSDKDVSKKIESINYCKSRVWLLFASNDFKKWECLQVAQSKRKVKDEINKAVAYLCSGININTDLLEYKNSLFYVGVRPEPFDGYSYQEVLYSMIGKQYKHFKICILNVDKYLHITPSESNETDAERIVEICKNQYAEAKIAYETLAVHWKAYNSGIDGQTIAFIAEQEDKSNYQ